MSIINFNCVLCVCVWLALVFYFYFFKCVCVCSSCLLREILKDYLE